MKIINLRRQGGFTLIELLVVIAILGGLMTVLFVSLGSNKEKANKGLNQTQLRTAYLDMQIALDEYKSKVGRFPSNDEGLEALVRQPTGVENWGGPYLKKSPLDPWGGAYRYSIEGSKYKIISLGADNREGGEGENADIDLASYLGG